MLLHLLTVTAIAQDMTAVKTAHGCEISMRTGTQLQGSAMYAHCLWPDVQLSTLQAMLSDFTGYADFIWPIDQVETRQTLDDRTLVYQLQEIWGISDREVLLWMSATSVPNGTRYQWTTAGEQPLTLRTGSIRTPKNEGYWQVQSTANGGVHVVHEIAVDAGGSIPKWIVRLVRTRGFSRVMGEVREYATIQQALLGTANSGLVPKNIP